MSSRGRKTGTAETGSRAGFSIRTGQYKNTGSAQRPGLFSLPPRGRTMANPAAAGDRCGKKHRQQRSEYPEKPQERAGVWYKSGPVEIIRTGRYIHAGNFESNSGRRDSIRFGDDTPIGSNAFANKTDTLVFMVPNYAKRNFIKTLFDWRENRSPGETGGDKRICTSESAG